MLRNKQIPLIYLLLATAALAVFWQVGRCDFIALDDPLYVTENPHVANGITGEAIRWAFATGYASNWHSLTWMSHMLDVQLFGLNPLGHHLTNLLFHIANTLLLFFVFHRMTKAPWKSAFVAALFALHPLHVESVAWVAERKDVLSTFFWMLTMAAYVNYVDGGRRTEDRGQRTEDRGRGEVDRNLPSSVFRYLAVLMLFALGLMAKPMLVTLPFVLLLLDYWPLGRFELHYPKFLKGVGGTSGVLETDSNPPPFLKGGRGDFGLKSFSAHGSLSTVHSSRSDAGGRGDFKVQASRSTLAEPVSTKKEKGKSRKKRAGRNVVREDEPADRMSQWALIRPLLLEKIPLLALAALSCVVTYAAQKEGGSVASFEVFPLGARIANAFVSYIVYIGKTVWPTGLAVYYPHPGSWHLWQVPGAVFILGAITLTVIRTANRFPYLTVGWLWFTGTLVPVIGIVQVGAQGMADRYTYIPLIGLFVIAAWGIPELLKRWRYGKEALFPASGLILACLIIVAWTQTGYWVDTISLYDHALDVTSGNYFIYNSRAIFYARSGDYIRAISDFNKAIEINSRSPDAFFNRGTAYARLGLGTQAIADFNRAIEVNSLDERAYNSRGIAYHRLGKDTLAIKDYDKAIYLRPESADAYCNRGNAWYGLGEYGHAISDYDKAIEIDPEVALAYVNRANLYALLGRHGEAIEDLKTAAKLGNERAKGFLKSQNVSP
ncbi:MAG: tetratricopeptide repeat protein [Syntrophobacteraceae bacterium]